MADTIIDGTKFDCNKEKLTYTNIKTNDKGGKSFKIIRADSKSIIRLQTPLMLTWGPSDYVDPTTGVGNGKYEMSLQFPEASYSTPECNAFLVNLQTLENKLKDDALTYSKDWFGKQHKNSDIIDELFTPMLKYTRIKGSSEPDYSKKPTIRLKLPQWEGVWKSEIYNENGEPLYPNPTNPAVTPLDFIKKGSTVACIIQCGGVWFTNGKFTLTWNLLQAVVQTPKPTIQGKCFISLNPNEIEKLKSANPGEDIELDDDNKIVGVEVIESDDEENRPDQESTVAEEEPEPEPVKEQKPVKTTTVTPINSQVEKIVTTTPSGTTTATVKKRKVVPKKTE